MTSKITPLRFRTGAFSLIEILAVVAIMATLAALSIPGISSTLNGMKITSATQTIVDEIQVARATALARNAPVEVWFIKDTAHFQSVRTSIVNADNTTTWISRARRLPEGIALASTENFSNVIGAQNTGTPPDSAPAVKGVRMRIFPSGKLELVDVLPAAQSVGPNQPLYLTITAFAGFDPDTGTTLPANFATVQINPVNARIITHRP